MSGVKSASMRPGHLCNIIFHYYISLTEGKRAADSLFLMSQTGTLVEYILDPKSKQLSDKVTDGTPLDLTITGYTQWHLQR